MAADRKSDEATIRRLIEDRAAAVRASKLRAVVAHHTDDVVMFDVPRRWPCVGAPPIEGRGRRSSRGNEKSAAPSRSSS